MKTSVVARPMRMIASDGDGRLRKRAIAPKKTSTTRVMAPTSPRAICQTSMPLNRPLNMTQLLFSSSISGGSPEELLVPVVAHQHHLRAVRDGRLAGGHTAVKQKLVAVIIVHTDLAVAAVQHRRGDHADSSGELVLRGGSAPAHVDQPRRQTREDAHANQADNERRQQDQQEPPAL